MGVEKLFLDPFLKNQSLAYKAFLKNKKLPGTSLPPLFSV